MEHDSFPCKRGVRQGCILSPLLFNLYTADLQRELRANQSGIELHNGIYLDMLMYADDIVLLSSSGHGLTNIYIPYEATARNGT